jgi:hypothetical protein
MGNPVTKNRMTDGGDRWVIGNGGTLEFEAGAEVVGGGLAVTPNGDLSTKFIHHYSIAPKTVSATGVMAATALTASAQHISAGITNPDVPRTVTVKGNASGITGNVVVHGTNVDGDVITDTIALNGTGEIEGIKAFASVTLVDFPVQTHAGTDTVSVGMAKKFGLPEIVDNAALLLVKLFNGSADNGTLAVDSDEVEKNLFAINGTPNDTEVLDLYYIA